MMVRRWIRHVTGLDAKDQMGYLEKRFIHNDAATQGAITAFKSFVAPHAQKDRGR
jgi:hypothetical protein